MNTNMNASVFSVTNAAGKPFDANELPGGKKPVLNSRFSVTLGKNDCARIRFWSVTTANAFEAYCADQTLKGRRILSRTQTTFKTSFAPYEAEELVADFFRYATDNETVPFNRARTSETSEEPEEEEEFETRENDLGCSITLDGCNCSLFHCADWLQAEGYTAEVDTLFKSIFVYGCNAEQLTSLYRSYVRTMELRVDNGTGRLVEHAEDCSYREPISRKTVPCFDAGAHILTEAEEQELCSECRCLNGHAMDCSLNEYLCKVCGCYPCHCNTSASFIQTQEQPSSPSLVSISRIALETLLKAATVIRYLYPNPTDRLAFEKAEQDTRTVLQAPVTYHPERLQNELALLANIAAEHIDGMRYLVEEAFEGSNIRNWYETVEEANQQYANIVQSAEDGVSTSLYFLLKQS